MHGMAVEHRSTVLLDLPHGQGLQVDTDTSAGQ
jgi:hypothetical protein